MIRQLSQRPLLAALLALGVACAATVPASAQQRTRPPAKKKPAQNKSGANKALPTIFYDKWSYRTATLYGKEKNIVSGISGEATFRRNGTFEQNYYIGSIGNFFKGTYKISGDTLTTFDPKGKRIFTFKYTVGTTPPILVLRLLEKNGSPSIDYSLVPLKKKEPAAAPAGNG